MLSCLEKHLWHKVSTCDNIIAVYYILRFAFLTCFWKYTLTIKSLHQVNESQPLDWIQEPILQWPTTSQLGFELGTEVISLEGVVGLMGVVVRVSAGTTNHQSHICIKPKMSAAVGSSGVLPHNNTWRKKTGQGGRSSSSSSSHLDSPKQPSSCRWCQQTSLHIQQSQFLHLQSSESPSSS